MNNEFKEIILKATGAEKLGRSQIIQELWSGYGQIIRYGLKGAKQNRESVVVKHVRLPKQENHPRGWNSDLSHRRKLKSYEVETAWYKKYSFLCGTACHVPDCLALESREEEVLMVLEDLNSSGFPARKTSVTWDQIKVCLSWLANFHAVFMGKKPEQLWKTGTYWHLDTRPEELEVLRDLDLKHAAPVINRKLEESAFLTFVHGDAKLANFCFSRDGKKAAAVDFQYVGGGCGMKDVAYFAGSCLYEDDCEKMETKILDYYFAELRKALLLGNKPQDARKVEDDWRPLYPVAWTDFHRFLKGWSPGHWKINSYSERLTREVLAGLTGPGEKQ